VCGTCNDTRPRIGDICKGWGVSFDNLVESAKSCGFCQIILSVALEEGAQYGTLALMWNARGGRRMGGISYFNSTSQVRFNIRDISGT
jgi:hypothetical protein